MRYINNREQFITDWRKKYTEDSKATNEAFDMSGGSGPMGNDINWGDSIVGRMFNSIFRKIGVQQDLKSINNVIKAIQKEFESIKIESQTNNVDKTKLSKLHISYLLEALTNAVHSGTKVIIIKSIAEETIDIVDESELPEDDKLEAIEELEAFLKFLEQYDDEIGEDLSDELTGIDSSEEEKAESISTSGWGKNTYSGMITMIRNLIKVIENKDNVSTTAQGEKEDKEVSKDKNYIKNSIIKSLKEVYETPLLEIFVTIRDNSIYFREEKLATVNEKGEFIANVGKWDSTNKRFTNKVETRIMKITNEIITNFSLHIANRLKETLGDKTVDKSVKLSESEVKSFNEKVSGKWAYMRSLQNNHYAVQIENIDNSGSFRNESIWKVEGDKVKEIKTSYGPTLISSLFKRGIIFNKQSDSFSKLKEKNKESSLEPTTSFELKIGMYKGDSVKIISEKGSEYEIEVSGKRVFVPKNEVTNIRTNESYEFLLEKSRLSDEETYANQALARLKSSLNELITEKSKKPAIDIDFLKSIDKSGSKKFINLFGSEIKNKYDQVSERIQNTPLYKTLTESIEMVDDTLLSGPKEKVQAKSLRSNAAEKIAMFASVSMLFVGEGLYGPLGELGKALEKFNNEFQKLLNTEFKKIEEKTEEKVVFSYLDFISINEKKTEKEISEEIKTYYDENVSYEKWVVTKEEVQEVDNEIENSKPSSVTYDRIIRIVKLFNKAHKIHTTDVIPSGRRSGKVSNRVFREYEYVGDGASPGRPVPEGGVEPGIGPYRNKKVFNKFESAIIDIIGDPKYKDFFSEDVKVTNLDDTESVKAGDGKILLKFMNDLLDGNKLYKSGAQSKFFAEYFGFKLDDKNFTVEKISDRKENKKEKSTEENLKDLKFTRVSEIINITNSVNAISMQNSFIYFVIISSDDDNVYIKYTTDFSKIDNNIKNKVNKGDISIISQEKGDIFYGSIKKDDFPISKENVDLNVISVIDVINNQQSIKVTNSKFSDIKSIYTLKVDEDIFKIKSIFPTEKTNDDITKIEYNNIIKPKLK
jgi:hypothetical protein